MLRLLIHQMMVQDREVSPDVASAMNSGEQHIFVRLAAERLRRLLTEAKLQARF